MTVVLLYHDVATADERETTGFPGPLAARYKLEPAAFAAHLDAVADTGVEIGLLASMRRPAAALTFDDAGSSALYAAAALEARGWRGHFFAVTSLVGTAGFLDAAGPRELAARGHVVGSHSHTHPTYMGTLPRARVADEWRRSREALGDILGELPILASVPGGFLSAAVVECAAAAGYAVLLTSEPITRVRHVGDMAVLGRFGIWSTTPSSTAAGYVTRRLAPRTRLWVEWKLKGTAKHASPGIYQALRRVRAKLTRPAAG